MSTNALSTVMLQSQLHPLAPHLRHAHPGRNAKLGAVDALQSSDAHAGVRLDAHFVTRVASPLDSQPRCNAARAVA